ncbi:hypothetical protein [Roseococcus pinisoli]|uniref:Transposase n=1 Tax=Roseococcus pinisoli TaxID=2835040 RepID=A0ABS5QFA7_9PROT|nr:hypothetical protein [Roseococcus pinisoli]MBS7812385.1 hypothetical protein [Roseococcus pinisoli]
MDHAVVARHAAGSQSWNKQTINSLLLSNDRAVERALCRLHDSQTQHEQTINRAKAHNNAGFTAPDAPALSPLAAKVKRGWRLYPRELAVARALDDKGYCRLAKYWRQLLTHNSN